MWRASRIILLGLLGSTWGACAARQEVLPRSYALGMGRAEYRDYGGPGALCEAEPRWLVDELGSVNGLLARFLTGTEGASAPTARRHTGPLELLEEAARTLGPVLEAHERNLEALAHCGFKTTGAFPELARRGVQLVKDSRARLAEAVPALAAAELREARRQWMEGAPAREAEAKRTWCAGSPVVGSGELYFAREYPNGHTEWLFCDGMMVESQRGAEPTLFTPEWISRKDRRRIQPRRYLDAARDYPDSEMDRQPGTRSNGDGAEEARALPEASPETSQEEG